MKNGIKKPNEKEKIKNTSLNLTIYGEVGSQRCCMGKPEGLPSHYDIEPWNHNLLNILTSEFLDN